jgi:hypothetical protein
MDELEEKTRRGEKRFAATNDRARDENTHIKINVPSFQVCSLW